MSIKNKWKVPKKRWNSWNRLARFMFNSLYEDLKEGWKVITPDSAHDLSPNAVRVAAWNIAWTAADRVDEELNVGRRDGEIYYAHKEG